MISIIVAVSRNGVIGARGKLLWHLSADLKRFKELTMGHAIVMGRKTHESIGRALPGRENIVVTRQKDYAAAGCVVVNSLDEAFTSAGDKEIFVIGGEEVYREALPVADTVYLTLIDHDFEGDVRFPEVDPAVWEEVERKEGTVDEKNVYPHVFFKYLRKL